MFVNPPSSRTSKLQETIYWLAELVNEVRDNGNTSLALASCERHIFGLGNINDLRLKISEACYVKPDFMKITILTISLLQGYLLQKPWQRWNKLLQAFNNETFMKRLKCCVGCNKQSVGVWGLQNNLHGKGPEAAIHPALPWTKLPQHMLKHLRGIWQPCENVF